ncbi:RagB/SusD family nutrient uptake outer membrane protein [Hymenobacter radiodurans]|uniref:RagB/SusD family nutrient uptake outer membrane protein n=1 Tax=Hymenobacter radiodurans TaxID=2496028 RepID=UPI001058E617|nr:RagB/SusD family nutrient uptake outer membrane protein [Hymenobacter radiodurans]
MKRSYRLITIALLTTFGLTTTACKDYLQEELVSTLTNDYYNTEKGLEDLVKAAYEQTRFKYANEHSYAMFNFGTDEFTHADQVNYVYWNTYERARLNTGNGIESFVHDVWTADYDGINRCNIGIDKIPAFTGTTTLATPAQKAQRLGELHFLRAYYYFQLVQQYGAIPISLKPTESVQLEYERTPVPQVYQQIIKDLRFAEENLSPTSAEFGRATKGAAQHYLAKVYLTRGSAITDERGQKPTDVDSAAYYADQVITSGRYILENDFARLWDISSYANNRAAQTSREVIFSTQFNNVITLAGRFGNRVHSYFTMFYEDTPGMSRDLLNDRPFRRLMPTNYTMDIYDRRNDSRFYKSFKTAWLANNAATIPPWTAANAPTPALVGQRKFVIGDTAIFIRVNTPRLRSRLPRLLARATLRLRAISATLLAP